MPSTSPTSPARPITPGGSAEGFRRKPKTSCPWASRRVASAPPTYPQPTMSALAIGGECQNRAGRPPAYTLPMTFVIGIATSLDHRERWRRGREYLYLDRRYSEAVAEAGALPCYCP